MKDQDSVSESQQSWFQEAEEDESETVPATEAQLAAMGRGAHWSAEEVALVQAAVTAGAGAKKLATDEGWPLSSTYKAYKKMQAGVALQTGGKVLTPAIIADAKAKLADQGGKVSQRAMARQLGLKRSTTRDLYLKVLKMQPLKTRTVKRCGSATIVWKWIWPTKQY